MRNEREEIAKENGMSIEFVNWFFENKKDGCGNVWFLMMAAMWESWKVLEQQLAESQREFRSADATIENLQMQVEKLAAENSGLKAVCEDRRMFIMNGVQLGYIQVPTVETDPALETIRVAVSPQEPTPATDDVLAEVRASGAEEVASTFRALADRDNCSVNMRCSYNLTAERAEAIAAQIRQGGAA